MLQRSFNIKLKHLSPLSPVLNDFDLQGVDASTEKQWTTVSTTCVDAFVAGGGGIGATGCEGDESGHATVLGHIHKSPGTGATWGMFARFSMVGRRRNTEARDAHC